MRCRDERGIAMITALLISLVLLFLSIAVISLSLHSSTQSSLDRKRVQAINASEAGIDAYESALTAFPDSSACQPIDADLPTSPIAHYRVDVTLYSTWPPLTGSEIPCPVGGGQALNATPLGALVVSKGTAVAPGSPTAVSRTMETEIRLSPVYGGFGKAIFSDQQLNLGNALIDNGNQGNDADVYTNGNFTLNNNTVIAGSVYAQGSANVLQGVVNANVWANNYVNMGSGVKVFGNVTSSTSYIQLSNNSHIYGNAKAATTITGGTIDGTKTPNSPSGPPPQVPFPHYPYTENDWDGPGANPQYTVNNYSSCSAAKTFIGALPTGNNVVRVSPTCGMSWGNNSVVNIKGNTAIITDGSFTTQNQNNWNGVGGTWTLFIIVPWRQGLNCGSGNYDVNVSNNSNFNNLNVFVYSQCTINFGNNNADGFHGQIIGGQVNITNNMTLDYVPIIAPGFFLLGYNSQPSYLREIINRTP